MHPKLDSAILQFLDSKLGNAWIDLIDPETNERFGEVYVRVGRRLIPGHEEKVTTFDVANIQVDVDKVGQGLFTKWLLNLIAALRHDNRDSGRFDGVYLENVQRSRFQAHIVKLGGWEPGRDLLDPEDDPSYYHEAGPYPDNNYVRDICKIGQMAACCRYLLMGANGWACGKHSSLKNQIDQRVAQKSMHAQSDNCDGLSNR